MATIFALNEPQAGGYDASLIVPIVISVVPAVLMVTSIRFRSFRNLLQPRGAAAWATTVAGALAIVVGLVLDPGITGLVIAYGYILQAPLGVLTAPLRESVLGPDSVAPRRERLPSVFLPDNDQTPTRTKRCAHDLDVDLDRRSGRMPMRARDGHWRSGGGTCASFKALSTCRAVLP